MSSPGSNRDVLAQKRDQNWGSPIGFSPLPYPLLPSHSSIPPSTSHSSPIPRIHCLTHLYNIPSIMPAIGDQRSIGDQNYVVVPPNDEGIKVSYGAERERRRCSAPRGRGRRNKAISALHLSSFSHPSSPTPPVLLDMGVVRRLPSVFHLCAGSEEEDAPIDVAVDLPLAKAAKEGRREGRRKMRRRSTRIDDSEQRGSQPELD